MIRCGEKTVCVIVGYGGTDLVTEYEDSVNSVFKDNRARAPMIA